MKRSLVMRSLVRLSDFWLERVFILKLFQKTLLLQKNLHLIFLDLKNMKKEMKKLRLPRELLSIIKLRLQQLVR
jgi:hypothetical protein